MPIRCVDPTGQSIQSFDLSENEWQTLEFENKKSRHLRMPCCSVHVTLKRSRLGTRFFAHKIIGSCATAPETEEHLHLKQMAVMAARAHGWTAQTEATGITPEGEEWRADVLATKGKHRVAVEIQWSGQTNDDTMRRQKQYKDSDVRGLWLLRQPGFPVTRDLPAACIGGSLKEGFQALIPTHPYMNARDRNTPDRWHQIVPMEQFLNAAFSKRLRFGKPQPEVEEAVDPNIVNVTVTVHTGVLDCWHSSCGAKTRIVTFINIMPDDLQFRVSNLDSEILRFVLDQLPSDLGIGRIKPRHSKTVDQTYMSNGCVRCDRLIGEHYEHDAWGIDETLHTFPMWITRERLKALRESRGYDEEERYAVEMPEPETWNVESGDTSSD
ncbi:competence protein CoiA [Microvirga sp. P5_D2]